MEKNTTYKINKINEDGSVEVSFSIDKKSQNISGLTVSDKETLYKELSKYGVAYELGLNVEVSSSVVIDPTIEKNKNIAIGA